MPVLILLLCLLTAAVTAQNFPARTDSLYQAKAYAAAAPMYARVSALAEFKGARASHDYNAACSYALAEKKDSALYHQ